jgi:hypothetical protein
VDDGVGHYFAGEQLDGLDNGAGDMAAHQHVADETAGGANAGRVRVEHGANLDGADHNDTNIRLTPKEHGQKKCSWTPSRF